MKIEILFEDDDLVAINKPPSLVVNQAQTVVGETVQEWFQEYLATHSSKNDWDQLISANFDTSFGTPTEIWQERQGVVHRLDKDTSGVLLLAKNPGALVNLLSQFKQRQTEKTYLCLAHGKFGVSEDTISAPLGRSSQNRLKFGIDAAGREASTSYKVEEYFSDLDYDQLSKAGVDEASIKILKKNSSSYQGFSLVRCWPKTGRTHQIRVHLAHIKHPLVGDLTYLGKKRKKLDPIWCARHFLHASTLVFNHPRTSKKMTVDAPLSDDLQSVLNLLKH